MEQQFSIYLHFLRTKVCHHLFFQETPKMEYIANTMQAELSSQCASITERTERELDLFSRLQNSDLDMRDLGILHLSLGKWSLNYDLNWSCQRRGLELRVLLHGIRLGCALAC